MYKDDMDDSVWRVWQWAAFYWMNEISSSLVTRYFEFVNLPNRRNNLHSTSTDLKVIKGLEIEGR